MIQQSQFWLYIQKKQNQNLKGGNHIANIINIDNSIWFAIFLSLFAHLFSYVES